MVCRSSTDVLGRAALAAAAVALASSLTTRAQAADPTDAEALLRSGVELRRAGRDAEALDVFRRAYAQSPTPRARAQLALAEQALSLWLEAERDITAALAANDDAWIRQNRDTLERALRLIAAKLAWVDVRSNVPTAAVLVNGRPAGTVASIGELRVVAGGVVVELRADGRTPVARSASVAPESKITIEVPMGPVEAAPKPAERPPLEGRPGGGQRTAGWITAAVGGVAIGAGLAFGARAMVLKGDRDSECSSVGCTLAGVDADRSGRTAALISTIATAGGAVVAGVGIALVLTAPKQSSTVRLETTGSFVSLSGSY